MSHQNLLELFKKTCSAKKPKKFSTNYFHRDFERLLLFVKGWIFLTHPLGSDAGRHVNGSFRKTVSESDHWLDDRSDHRVEGAATLKTAA